MAPALQLGPVEPARQEAAPGQAAEAAEAAEAAWRRWRWRRWRRRWEPRVRRRPALEPAVRTVSRRGPAVPGRLRVERTHVRPAGHVLRRRRLPGGTEVQRWEVRAERSGGGGS